MRIEYGSFVSKHDNILISTLTVCPDSAPKAIVQLAHGMAEHKKRYLPFMQYLAERGYLCCMNDHRGHGESIAEKAGYFGKDGGAALVEDMHQLTGLLKREYPGLPFFLFGHSMGSLAVRAYTKRYDYELDGLIVCGCPTNNPGAKAGLALTRATAKLKGGKAYSATIRNLAGGGFNANFEADGPNGWLTTDPIERDKFEKDKLCGFEFTLNGYESLLWLMCDCYSTKGWAMKNRALPIYFVSGADDPCAAGEKKLREAAAHLEARGYAAPEVRIWPGMRHEVLNEIGREQVMEELATRLDGWLAAKSAN